jgi:hypothetical protein
MPKVVRSGFEDLDEIRGHDGVTAVISRRLSNNSLSVGIFKVFTRDGSEVTEKTSFWNSRHIAAVREVLDRVEVRIKEIEATSR